MSTRKISFAPGSFYHVYNRGTDKRVIFKDIEDYNRFTQLLYICNSNKAIDIRSVLRSGTPLFEYDRGNQLVSIGAYCLMPNHFHLLISPIADTGMSTFMNKLGTSYSMYFNKKYDRSGGLFEGPFKATIADSDTYLKYLFSYIHLNPVKLIQSDWKESGIKNVTETLLYLQTYRHSSFQDYDILLNNSGKQAFEYPILTHRKETNILNIEIFPEYFKTHTDFQKEILDWITFNPATFCEG